MAESTADEVQAPAPPTKWPVTCPYYNQLKMQCSTLRELNDDLIYEGEELVYIKLKGDQIRGNLGFAPKNEPD